MVFVIHMSFAIPANLIVAVEERKFVMHKPDVVILLQEFAKHLVEQVSLSFLSLEINDKLIN